MKNLNNRSKELTLGPKYVRGTPTVETPTVSAPSLVIVKVDAERYGGNCWVGSTEETTTVETPVDSEPSTVTVKVEADKYEGSC